MTIDSEDYYEILDVDRQATETQIRKAYKKLALRWHPDRNPDDVSARQTWDKIHQAHDILIDPAQRAEHDAKGTQRALDRLFHEQRPCQHNKDPFKDLASFGSRGDPGGSGDPFAYLDGLRNSTSQGYGSGMFDFDHQRDGLRGLGRGGIFEFDHQRNGPRGLGHGGIFEFEPTTGSAPQSAHGFDAMPGSSPGVKRSVSLTRNQKVTSSLRFCIPRNTHVAVHGLSSAPEHNGKQGTVVDWVSERCRYQVQLDDCTILLRPQSLTQQCQVKIIGMKSMIESNGKTAKVLTYDNKKHRYSVMVDNIGDMDLQAENCLLEAGTCVTLQGLADPALNGEMARIVEVDLPGAKYHVQCQNGQKVRIKLDKVLF